MCNIESRSPLVFQYDSFEQNLYNEVFDVIKKYRDREDIYALSLKYEPGYMPFIAIVMNSYSYLEKIVGKHKDDYFYYKYCEEEWEIAEKIHSVSDRLVGYYEALEEWKPTDEYLADDVAQEHIKKVITSCCNVLKRIKDSKEIELCLNVFVREYFSDEEMVFIYKMFNIEKHVQEFEKYIYGVLGQ